MDQTLKRTPQMKDTLIALLHDLLDAAEAEGLQGWHLIREAEGRVWEARNMRTDSGTKKAG